MILYVNGDSHTAAAEAVNQHAFAEDDPALNYLHRLPHPDNLAVSWGKRVSGALKCTFKCDAESAASNARIMRTTRAWIEQHRQNLARAFMIIQWSTWEREEWLINGDYYQVGSSGIDDVPQEAQEKYRNFVIGTDWKLKTQQAHSNIWQLHQELTDLGIKHVFFNGNNHFAEISLDQRHDWGASYIGPYDAQMTWDQWLRRNGHETVSPNSWHFGEAAHGAWARFMLQYIVDNKLI
jgi:hypothetical protein